MPEKARVVLSIDVEDWFHILEVAGSPPVDEWSRLESRVERNFERLLELLDSRGARATCFFLGWVAKRHPGMVRRALDAGHEVASHGNEHRLVYGMTREGFRSDAENSRKLLEDIGGAPVLGFRAPGFSATGETPWYFEELVRAGYRYDSSVFPARRGHGGWPKSHYGPTLLSTPAGDLVEFPASTISLGGARLACFGGGYLRLSPYWFTRWAASRLRSAVGPVVYYVHPREIDIRQPRLRMGPGRYFKSYINLKTTYGKLANILAENETTTFAEFLDKWSAFPEEQMLAEVRRALKRFENGISQGAVTDDCWSALTSVARQYDIPYLRLEVDGVAYEKRAGATGDTERWILRIPVRGAGFMRVVASLREPALRGRAIAAGA